MKNLFAVVLICLATNTLAQSTQSPYVSGGFGHFYTGPVYAKSAALDNFIRNPKLMGDRYRPNDVGTVIGGEGFGVRRRWMIGGGGYAIPMFNNQMDSATMNGGSGVGYFKTGYQFHQSYANFAYVYGAAGYGNTSLTIKKITSVNEATNPEQKDIKYNVSNAVFEVGIGCKLIFCGEVCGSKKFGGFIVGLDSGCFFNVPTGTEYNFSSHVPPPPNKTMVLPYMRMTIGGGGFHR